MAKTKVGDWMTPNPITIDASATIVDAINLLKERNIRRVPVMKDGRLAGIISDKDIFRTLYERPEGIDGLTVGELMTVDLIIGVEDDEIGYIAGIMTNNRIRHVPIVEGERLVGLLSVGDIVKTQMSHMEIENRHLWQYINGSYPG